MIFYKKQVESNMKVTPIISILMTNEETKNDQLVKDIFIQLKLNYLVFSLL